MSIFDGISKFIDAAVDGSNKYVKDCVGRNTITYGDDDSVMMVDGTVIIHRNGKSYQVTKKNGKWYIDGKPINWKECGMSEDGSVTFEIHGNVKSLTTVAGDVNVTGSVDSVKTTSGNIKCEYVKNSITSVSGDIECGDVGGNVQTTSGDVNCRAVSGNVTTVSGDVYKR